MEPTGPPLAVNCNPNRHRTNERFPLFIPRTCLIRPFSDVATARRPDIVLDETVLSGEPPGNRNCYHSGTIYQTSLLKSSAPTGKLITPEKLKSMLQIPSIGL